MENIDTQLFTAGVRAICRDTHFMRTSSNPPTCIFRTRELIPFRDTLGSSNAFTAERFPSAEFWEIKLYAAGIAHAKKIGAVAHVLQNLGLRNIEIRRVDGFYAVRFYYVCADWVQAVERVLKHPLADFIQDSKETYTLMLPNSDFDFLHVFGNLQLAEQHELPQATDPSVQEAATLLKEANERIKVLEELNLQLANDNVAVIREYRQHSAVAEASGINEKKPLTLYCQGDYLDD